MGVATRDVIEGTCMHAGVIADLFRRAKVPAEQIR